MGSTMVGPASLASLAALLRLLRTESTAAHGTTPWAMPIRSASDLLRALTILAQLRDGGPTTKGRTTSGGATPDPMAPAPQWDPFKLPSLFTEGTMFPAMPLF